jgi:hypothetical protein
MLLEFPSRTRRVAWTTLVILLVLTLPFTQSLGAPAVEDAKPACALESAAVVGAFYASHPGFLDAVPVNDPPRVLVLFDASAVDDAPGAVANLVRVPVEVVAVDVTPDIGSPADEPLPEIVPDACLGTISPGARIDTDKGRCTANFVFEDENGVVYLGSAGHCHGELGSSVSIPTVGGIGDVVFIVDKGMGHDFALIRLHDHVLEHVNPAMCHWGGPTTDEGSADHYEVLQHYGFGLGYGANQLTRAREGVAWGENDVRFAYVATTMGGDSGAAVRHENGAAIGIHTHSIGAAGVGLPAGFGYGTVLEHAITLAEADLQVELTLVTAPDTPRLRHHAPPAT